MITLKLNNYNEKQANILLELLRNNFEAIQDDYCLLSIPVADKEKQTVSETIFCSSCPVKNICEDLKNTIDFLEDWTALKAASRKSKISSARKKYLHSFP